MSRTNVDIDEVLVAAVMRRYGLATKRAAVDLALRRLVGEPLDRQEALDMAGTGWDGDLERLRAADAGGGSPWSTPPPGSSS